MKNTSLLIFLLFVFGCSSNNIEKQLSRSELIKSNFTESDIPSLAKMIEFTDSLVIKKTGNSDIALAYHDFLDSMYAAVSLKNGFLLSLDSKSVYPFLLSLDSITFNKIWRVRTSYNRLKYKDSIYINPDNFMHIDFNMGPFFDFTEDLATENNNYQGIDEPMKLAGDISITAWIYILKENKKFDYNNIDERLWISINLLRCTETTDIKTLKE